MTHQHFLYPYLWLFLNPNLWICIPSILGHPNLFGYFLGPVSCVMLHYADCSWPIWTNPKDSGHIFCLRCFNISPRMMKRNQAFTTILWFPISTKQSKWPLLRKNSLGSNLHISSKSPLTLISYAHCWNTKLIKLSWTKDVISIDLVVHLVNIAGKLLFIYSKTC